MRKTTPNTLGNYAHGFRAAAAWDRKFPGQRADPGGPWYSRAGGTPDLEAEHHAWMRGFKDGRAVVEGRMG